MSARALACTIADVDLVSALGRAGIRSAVVARPGTPALYSRHTARRLEWADPWTEPEKLVARLLDFAATQPEPPVLFYDADGDLLAVSRHRDELRQAFRFVVADAELVEDLVDKARFQQLAERLDLPLPRGVRISAAAALPCVDLRYPLVAKPLTRRNETWGALTRAKAVHVADPAELRRVHGELASRGVDVLLQELVPGPESRIESYHVYVDHAGAVVAEFTGRKLRTYPRGYGYSTALELTDARDVLALGRALVVRLGLIGVAKLDFKRDDEGRLHLLEVNPRFNLWHYPAAVAGVNLPALVHADLTGEPRPPVLPPRPHVRWCSLRHDYPAARQAGSSRLEWLRWAITCETKSGFSFRDPLPLPRAILWRVSHRLRRRLAAGGGERHRDRGDVPS